MQIPDLGVDARMDKNCLTVLEWDTLATMVMDASLCRPPVPTDLEHSGSDLHVSPLVVMTILLALVHLQGSGIGGEK